MWRRWRCIALLLTLAGISALLWGAVRSFDLAADISAFTALPEHDYLEQIRALEQQRKLDEALALSQFVCTQPTYPQQHQACERARLLRHRTRAFWHRARSVGLGAATGSAANGWALAGATAADFLVLGDMRDLVLQSWRLSQRQDADRLLMALSAIGLLTVVTPGFDWMPSFGKAAVRVGAFSKPLMRQLAQLSQRAVTTRKWTPLRRPFENMRHLIQRLGAAKTLGVLPAVQHTDDLATLARMTSRYPHQTYGLIKAGGHQAIRTVNQRSTAVIPALLQAARKGADGMRLLQRLGPRLFTSHLLVGASKAFYRGRLSQAMAFWLATQAPLLRLLITLLLAALWGVTIVRLQRAWTSP